MRRGVATIGLAAAAMASLGQSEALAACDVGPDVLPVPLPSAPAAAMLSAGAAPGGGANWVVSGYIYRCANGGSQAVEISTPPEMGITETAAIHMAINGIQLTPERQQTGLTEWRFNSPAVVEITDPGNSDANNNRLTVRWDASLNNVVSYAISYTLYLHQK